MMIVFGLGYVGSAVAAAARASGHNVAVTTRAVPGAGQVGFCDVGPLLSAATYLLSTVPPEPAGDPVLTRYGAAIAAAPKLRWIGYVSTTGIYGTRSGAWVTEATEPRPNTERSVRRLAAEAGWASFVGHPVDVFRVAGIYGPGRSALDQVREGLARRVLRPGHVFSRIHRDDIVRAVLAAMAQHRPSGVRFLNLADDEPAESAAVIEEAAHLLGHEPPPAVPFDEAWLQMSEMARSFWMESRRVSSRATQAALGIGWRYPTYREGLRAILNEEQRHRVS